MSRDKRRNRPASRKNLTYRHSCASQLTIDVPSTSPHPTRKIRAVRGGFVVCRRQTTPRQNASAPTHRLLCKHANVQAAARGGAPTESPTTPITTTDSPYIHTSWDHQYSVKTHTRTHRGERGRSEHASRRGGDEERRERGPEEYQDSLPKLHTRQQRARVTTILLPSFSPPPYPLTTG